MVCLLLPHTLTTWKSTHLHLCVVLCPSSTTMFKTSAIVFPVRTAQEPKKPSHPIIEIPQRSKSYENRSQTHVSEVYIKYECSSENTEERRTGEEV
ncbi:hypothetical protein ECG_06666 [Echinococcus granulosus]|uniref:Expressed protein n=1 Tax=Echinococcus granulosus TaxID=6210 RepID=A0A068WNN6_ECHGR|nr:hypothetical protein ECG_06666 [Echinococcus granulosus]CDS19241.1 expressed protein [Echinococcus granulosus]